MRLKWIHVEDELPAAFDPVLVCFDTTCLENQIDVCWLRDGLWWTDARHALDRLYEVVHHWMPLADLLSIPMMPAKRSKPGGFRRAKGILAQ